MRKETNINSNKGELTKRVIEVEGRVASLTRRNERVVMITIADELERREVVDFPFSPNNLFLRLVEDYLKEQAVKYSHVWEHWCFNNKDCGSTERYILQVLGGQLQGVYTEKDFQL